MPNIVRRGPFSNLLTVRNEMDRLMNDVFRFYDDRLTEGPLGWQPDMDIYETENEFVASLEVPGINKEDIKINVVDNKVTISGETVRERKEEKENYFLQERSTGRFSRGFVLPTPIDSTKIQANCRNGVLELKIPKAEQAKPREIEITGE